MYKLPKLLYVSLFDRTIIWLANSLFWIGFNMKNMFLILAVFLTLTSNIKAEESSAEKQMALYTMDISLFSMKMDSFISVEEMILDGENNADNIAQAEIMFTELIETQEDTITALRHLMTMMIHGEDSTAYYKSNGKLLTLIEMRSILYILDSVENGTDAEKFEALEEIYKNILR